MSTKINWVVVCTMENDGEMYAPHMVGYENKPNSIVLKQLIEELRTDEKFGMTTLEYNKDYKISVAEREGSLKEYFDSVGVPSEF